MEALSSGHSSLGYFMQIHMLVHNQFKLDQNIVFMKLSHGGYDSQIWISTPLCSHWDYGNVDYSNVDYRFRGVSHNSREMNEST